MAEQLFEDVVQREREGQRNSVVMLVGVVVALVIAVAALVVWAHAAS